MNQLSVVLFAIVWFIINIIFYKKMFTFPTIITLIWCTSLFFSLFGFYDTFIPSDSVMWYTFVFLSSFNVFSILFNKFSRKNKSMLKTKEFNNKFVSLILCICILGIIVMCFDSLLLFIKTNNMSVIRNSFINYDSINMHSQVFLTITFIPLGKAAYIYSILNYIKTKKINSSFVLSIVFALLTALFTGGRGILFIFVLILLTSMLNNNQSKKIFENKKIKRLVLAFIIVMLIITSQRSFGGRSIFNSIYVYFCGCFNLFGVYLEKGLLFKDNLLFGRELLSGISFPFLQTARYLFHMNVLPGNYILAAEATAKYIGISPTIAINATPTTMYACIRDFGLSGLIIYPGVISFIYYKFLKNRNNNMLSESNYVYYTSCCLLLILSYQFATFQTVSVFMYLYLIYIFLTTSLKES